MHSHTSPLATSLAITEQEIYMPTVSGDGILQHTEADSAPAQLSSQHQTLRLLLAYVKVSESDLNLIFVLNTTLSFKQVPCFYLLTTGLIEGCDSTSDGHRD